MKNFPVISLLLFLFVCACSARKRQPPEILEEKKIDVSSIYKKRGADLVEALYEELVRNSDDLKELEKQIQEIKAALPDSLEDYRAYHEKIVSYYDAAEKKAATVSDSVLREAILKTITKSRNSYRDSTASLVSLDSLVRRKTETLTNLHELLKITSTLPVIEDFQKTNQPQPFKAEELTRRMDELIVYIDSLAQQVNIEHGTRNFEH